MLIEKIKSECIYVMTLWIIITWGLMLTDVQHRWRTQAQNWEHVIDTHDGWTVAATTGQKQ